MPTLCSLAQCEFPLRLPKFEFLGLQLIRDSVYSSRCNAIDLLSVTYVFQECLYKGRFRVANTVDGYQADIGASGAFCPSHLKCPVKITYYAIDGGSRFTNPYVATIRLRKKGYRVPRKGKVQVTLFNHVGSVVKMFLIPYDLTDMPLNSQTFVRQRTLYMPNDANVNDPRALRHWLRYSIHLK